MALAPAEGGIQEGEQRAEGERSLKYLTRIRVELPTFWRLPRVLKSLPQELVDYKGLTRYRQTTIDWLSKFDDGAPTSPGIFPD